MIEAPVTQLSTSLLEQDNLLNHCAEGDKEHIIVAANRDIGDTYDRRDVPSKESLISAPLIILYIGMLFQIMKIPCPLDKSHDE